MKSSGQVDGGRNADKKRRVSLSKHRSEIEQWVSQGRSDEWIADALGTSQSSVQSFRSRHKIKRNRRPTEEPVPAEEHGEHSADPAQVYEGVLDQGEEGYGLWLDPAVADDPTFRQSFAGVSDIRVVVEHGRIVLEPAPEDSTKPRKQPIEQPKSDKGAPEPMAQADAGSATAALAATGAGSESGRVKFFDDQKGYGFITLPGGGELFFHRSEIQGSGELDPGDFVYYEPGSSPRGPVATKVRTVS